MTEDDAQALQADLLVRVGAREDADRALAALTARAPSLAAPRLSLALLRMGEDRAAEAVELLRALVKADADNFAAQVYLASALLEAGEPGEAAQAAAQATRLNAESVQAWSALSLAAALADDMNRAEAAMSSLMRLSPDPAYYQRERARLEELLRIPAGGCRAGAAPERRPRNSDGCPGKSRTRLNGCRFNARLAVPRNWRRSACRDPRAA
jgi:predicted Zn-dependent protease